MIKKIIYLFFAISLFFVTVNSSYAQSSNITADETITFNRESVPGWARDLRRYDIIAFGTFPFTMLFSTWIYDGFLRTNPPGMFGNHQQNIVLMAAGASLTLALADIIIVNIKRSRNRRNIILDDSEFYEIETVPYGEPESEDILPE